MSKSMKKQNYFLYPIMFVLAVLISAAAANAQNDNRIAVPLADPARPASVRAHLLNGSLTVKGADVKEILVEAHVRDEGREGRGERGEGRGEGRGPSAGMKRIPMTSTGLNVEAENNQVRISTDAIQRTVDVTVTVPVHTSLSLKTVNDGNILVTGVDGELDIDNVNGDVALKNVSGSVVAHALNGKVLATFNRVDPQKPMAFSSLNGDIDVTFPADLKANVNMRTDNGEVYSDFDVQLTATAPQQVVEDGRSQGGKYRVKVDKTVRGKINGGGPEIQFKDFNGNIYIRKAGAR
jgi:DUF4097 and DUF4098 domain-containing protein YvlB